LTALSELAVPGTLRVGINLGNSLLVTGANPNGAPEGVAPEMAARFAAHLGVDVSYLSYATPGDVADAGERGEWDICLIAVEPKRAEKITFSDAYIEIEATYLVPENSTFQSFDEVDQPGVRIAVMHRAAYDLYLSRTLKHAELRHTDGQSSAFDLFVAEELEAVAGLAPGLNKLAAKLPGSRVMAGCYTAVRQAFGARPDAPELSAAIAPFIAEAKQSGLVADLIEKYGVTGKLQVATG